MDENLKTIIEFKINDIEKFANLCKENSVAMIGNIQEYKESFEYLFSQINSLKELIANK